MDKAQFLKALTPIAVLQPLTPEASDSIPLCYVRHTLVPIYEFPFRIGRESRVRVDERTGKPLRTERHKRRDSEPNNDLYLLDKGEFLNISRAHLQIVRFGGQFKVIDRDSACGCLINGRHFGGRDKGGERLIEDGDELGIGNANSPYRFRFVVLESV
ncbi:FHA domain-containing protein [Acidihalobacter ferrooxydans]|uniref:FHA domain-containing protein n=1 Tax=Acidihalobacter ferrooxydans TaxID=1765967 RepID=A0A1P8UIN7_9GAMM|nr:FHA domain-containing protein [Acidihalobacter ferrooxydans]APZ43698.1 hypothetical protein BW247_11850 [Acidihalobacter ferrooxydans]